MLTNQGPGSAVHALMLPGVIDVLSDLQAKRVALTEVVSEQNSAHNQQIVAIESVVNNNKAANDSALREAYSVRWLDCARKFWQLSEDTNQQKLDVDNKIAELNEEHRGDFEAASERFTLLERSPWRKFVDWWNKNVLAVRGWLHSH